MTAKSAHEKGNANSFKDRTRREQQRRVAHNTTPSRPRTNEGGDAGERAFAACSDCLICTPGDAQRSSSFALCLPPGPLPPSSDLRPWANPLAFATRRTENGLFQQNRKQRSVCVKTELKTVWQSAFGVGGTTVAGGRRPGGWTFLARFAQPNSFIRLGPILHSKQDSVGALRPLFYIVAIFCRPPLKDKCNELSLVPREKHGAAPNFSLVHLPNHANCHGRSCGLRGWNHVRAGGDHPLDEFPKRITRHAATAVQQGFDSKCSLEGCHSHFSAAAGPAMPSVADQRRAAASHGMAANLEQRLPRLRQSQQRGNQSRATKRARCAVVTKCPSTFHVTHGVGCLQTACSLSV